MKNWDIAGAVMFIAIAVVLSIGVRSCSQEQSYETCLRTAVSHPEIHLECKQP